MVYLSSCIHFWFEESYPRIGKSSIGGEVETVGTGLYVYVSMCMWDVVCVVRRGTRSYTVDVKSDEVYDEDGGRRGRLVGEEKTVLDGVYEG